MTGWRLATPIDDIRSALLGSPVRPDRFANTTLVAVDGSAPRDVGAQILMTPEDDRDFLSGGCIDADVARRGRAPRL